MRVIDADVLLKQLRPTGLPNEVWKECATYKSPCRL